MQLMATRGLEHEIVAGLDWIRGDVAPILPDDPGLKIPHMGWNTLNVKRAHPALAGVATGENGLHAYFVHSFQLYPADAADVVATADYGGPVTAMVGARQYRRHAVPSRKEPDARPGADRQFPQVAPVILFPAIDLKGGQCVRLIRGDMAQATVFNADPAAQARAFEAQGFDCLHVVDLDGAFAGKPMQRLGGRSAFCPA